MNISADAWYRQIGVREIRLEAGSDPGDAITGPQVWPTQGFDFVYDRDRDAVHGAAALGGPLIAVRPSLFLAGEE